MCLAVPGLVTAIDTAKQSALVDFNGLSTDASTMLLPDVQVGDYVLVHAGFIIQQLQEKEGAELAALAAEAGLYE